MIHYQDDHTAIEINGRVVVIVPRPPADRDRAVALQRLFPEGEGWTHYRYGIHQVVECEQNRLPVALMAEERIRGCAK
jgi:hypothetical protein